MSNRYRGLGCWSCVVLWAAYGLGAAQVEQANWPQFRGPNASGYSEAANPPTVIGPAEGLLWQVEVPWSPSSPCIWEDKIFLTTYNQGTLETRAHDRKSGRLLWSRPVRVPALEDYHSTDGSPAASTPATDGKRVVSYFGSFGLICYDFQGEEQWRHPLPLALSGGRYGSGTSPIIAGGRVVLNRDQDMNSSLLALDVRSGERVWEVPRPAFRGGYGTPVIWQNQGRNEVVLPGSMQLKSYDLADGGEIWSVGGYRLSRALPRWSEEASCFLAPGVLGRPTPRFRWTGRLFRSKWIRMVTGGLCCRNSTRQRLISCAASISTGTTR